MEQRYCIGKVNILGYKANLFLKVTQADLNGRASPTYSFSHIYGRILSNRQMSSLDVADHALEQATM